MKEAFIYEQLSSIKYISKQISFEIKVRENTSQHNFVNKIINRQRKIN